MRKKWTAGSAVPLRVVIYFLIEIFSLSLYFAISSQCTQVGCWLSFFSIFVIFVSGIMVLEVYVTLEYDEDYDPHMEVLDIASTFSLDAEKITRLLKFSVVTISIFEAPAAFILALYTVFNVPFMNGTQTFFFNHVQKQIVRIVAAMIAVLPALVWTQGRYRESNGSVFEATKAFVRVDIYIMYFFLKFMVCVICPLSVLSSISVLKSQSGWFQSVSKDNVILPQGTQNSQATVISIPDINLLSFQLRDNWKDVDNSTYFSDDGLTECSCCVDTTRSIIVAVDRLSKRFTVVYSFLKLCGTIAFTLFADTGYLACGDPSRIHSNVTCDVVYDWSAFEDDELLSRFPTCEESCIGTQYPAVVTYPADTSLYIPPLPPTPWTCTATLPNACVCNDWLIFQFSIIVLHALHYVVQCYFYIRYNYFDPQQNQINCVETYTFAGSNLTLFLTQPAMCLLSVIETACIVIVWIGAISVPGVYCSGDVPIAKLDVYFAFFITVAEVYKANMSTCAKLVKRREFKWALWSLVRPDLFIFYGFTLFLQTFFFPFSVAGYIWAQYKFGGDTIANASSVIEETLQSPFSAVIAEDNACISHDSRLRKDAPTGAGKSSDIELTASKL
jgi:hypothetical protein